MRIGVLVSGGGTNLQVLLDAKVAGKIPKGEFVCVVSSKEGAFALERAKKHGIETAVISPKSYDDPADFNRAMIDYLQGKGVELVVLAGYLSILSPAFVQAFQNRMLNVHPSLIPAFCGKGFYGLKVHQAVLDYGVKVTGATVHIVNEITDGGPIVLQKAVAVEEGDTPEKLQKRVMEQGEWEILPKAVALFTEGKIRQDGRKTTILP